jgi:hypothetical protein
LGRTQGLEFRSELQSDLAARVIGAMGTLAVHTLRLCMFALWSCFVGAFVARVVFCGVIKCTDSTAGREGAPGSSMLEPLAVPALPNLGTGLVVSDAACLT